MKNYTSINHITTLLFKNNLSYNNFHQLDDNPAFTLGNVLLHTLSHSDQFDLHTRKLQPRDTDAFTLVQPHQLIREYADQS